MNKQQKIASVFTWVSCTFDENNTHYLRFKLIISDVMMYKDIVLSTNQLEGEFQWRKDICGGECIFASLKKTIVNNCMPHSMDHCGLEYVTNILLLDFSVL